MAPAHNRPFHRICQMLTRLHDGIVGAKHPPHTALPGDAILQADALPWPVQCYTHVKSFFWRDINRELTAWGLLLELSLLLFWALSGVWRGSPRLVWAFFIPGSVWLAACWRVLGCMRSRSSVQSVPRNPLTAFLPSPPSIKPWEHGLGLPGKAAQCSARGLRRHARGGQGRQRTRFILLGFAAIFHLTMLLTPHPLSNDLDRYAWDGKLLSLGINPYAYPPAAAELAGLRDPGWEQIFNRDVPTGYPPLSEALFAAAYRLGHLASFGMSLPGGPLGMLRLMAALASLGAAALLMRALRLSGSDERRVIVYAWAPLVALEFANSGHLDVYAILFLSAALVCALSLGWRQHSLGTAVFLALGGLAKFYPAFLAPLWGRRWGWRPWAVFLLVSGIGWLPFLLAGSPLLGRGVTLAGQGTPFTGLGLFALRGDFNGGVYRLVEGTWFWLLDSAYARLWAKATVVALLGLAYLQLLRRPDTGKPVDWRGAGAWLGLVLLISPVVHPWYFCWMLAFTAIEGSPAWLVLAVTSIFARTVYIGYEASGEWHEPLWTAWAVWLPFYFYLGWNYYKKYSGMRLQRQGTLNHEDTRYTKAI